MNRIEFVGNAIFIPFFLISVGMLINYRAFFKDFETLKVAAVMTVIATFSKFAASWLTQKSFRFSADERNVIFGLSNAQAAATLAAVLVGYNVIIGKTPNGDPIRLLNDSILNGTIIMILITCTIASFVAQKAGQHISLSEELSPVDESETGREEKILIPLSNPDTLEELISLSTTIKSGESKDGLYALNIVNHNTSGTDTRKKARKMLERAAIIAASTDIRLQKLLRYDLSIMNGITGVIREHGITDLIMGLHVKKGISESFLGHLTEGILTKNNITTFVYKPVQPIATIKRHIVVIPENAENEIGFPFWLIKVWNMARSTGSKLLFYGAEPTIHIIRDIHGKYPVEAEFNIFNEWNDFLILSRDIKPDDNLLIVLSRENKPSYHSSMANVPSYLNKYFHTNSFILVYPIQMGVTDHEYFDMKNPLFLEPFEKVEEIGNIISRLIRKK